MIRAYVPDDVPAISVARGKCGSVGNPHQVRSPSALSCSGCGENVRATLLERLRASLAPKAEVAGG
jgi:hypothetical protein